GKAPPRDQHRTAFSTCFKCVNNLLYAGAYCSSPIPCVHSRGNMAGYSALIRVNKRPPKETSQTMIRVNTFDECFADLIFLNAWIPLPTPPWTVPRDTNACFARSMV
ncbi:unnamed protein product, partial [Ectocarpus sp. 12 AP-2014]